MVPAPITGGSGPGGFILANGTSNLRLWLEGNVGLPASGNISSWADQSGYNFNATQGTGANQPTVSSLNGLPAALFVTANFQHLDFTGIPAVSVAVVSQVNSGEPSLMGLIGGSTDYGIRRASTTAWVNGAGNTNANDFTNPASSTFSVNGTLFSGNATQAEGTPAIDLATRGGGSGGNFSSVGSYYSGRGMNGLIAEVVIFDRALNAAEQQILNNALSAKYGITLAAGDVYSGDLAANGSYASDIFGIGQVSAGNSVTTAGAAGFGIEEASSLASGQFIMAGHNVPVNSLVTTNLPPTVSQRWNRVWDVDQTSNPGPASFTFDLTNGGGLAGSTSGYSLLYSATDPALGGTFSVLNLPATVVGSQIQFTVPSALLQDGYYTLGYSRPVADLSITKTDTAGSVSAGQSITYSIVVTNNGPSNSAGVGVTDVLPAGVSNVTWTATTTAGVTGVPAGPQSGNINLSGISLPVGGQIFFTVNGSVNGSAGGSLVNTATVNVPSSLYDPNLANNTATVTNSVQGAAIFATGVDSGGVPQVRIYDSATGQLKTSFFALDPTFTGGVRVAVGDVNGDGTPDVISAAGPGGLSQVTIYDGKTGTITASFFAFPTAGIPGFQDGTAGVGPSTVTIGGFTGGMYVAAGDVNGDGCADIIIGADAGGGPQVEVFDGKTGTLLSSFYAFVPSFTGGVRVAAGDVNGDGKADILVAAGKGGGPQVEVFDGKTGGLLTSFFAMAPGFNGGLYVAAADLNGDGKADIITGAGPGGGPQVTSFDGKTLQILSSFYAMTPTFRGGVRVGASTANGKVQILTAAGKGGGPQVTTFDSSTLALLNSFFAYTPGFTGGMFVS